MKRRFAFVVATAVLFASAGPSVAQLARGVELFERAEFSAAVQVLTPLANSGDAKAQYVLGVMYLNGMANPPSEASAAELMIKSGEAGFEKAQVELARMYREGHGVEQDFAKSLLWSKKAAEAGDVGAQLQVADAFAFGHGVKPDPVEAYKWYEIAVLYWGPLAVNARDLVAKSMTPDQVAKAKAAAEDWIKARKK